MQNRVRWPAEGVEYGVLRSKLRVEEFGWGNHDLESGDLRIRGLSLDFSKITGDRNSIGGKFAGSDDMASYLRNVIETLTSVFEGLSITFSYLVRRPTTTQYPDRIDRRVQETLPKRYRGHLEVDLDICTNCKACERECPISCIAISDSEEPDKKRWMTQFDIDLAKCMYCGICSEVCPTGAIRHSQEFEGACYHPATMTRRFVLDPSAVAPYRPKKAGEPDPEMAQHVQAGKEFMDLFAHPER